MFPDLTKLTPVQKGVQDHVAKLNGLRTQHPAIRYGSRRAIRADRDVYAVARAYLGDRVLILYNRSDKPAKLELEVGPEFADGPIHDRLGSLEKLVVKNGALSLTLPPSSSAFLTR
ncbi:MAG: hypothetical protein EB101_10545 [Chitinophagia bacterium]|nr:hypothetical protein [Chitinophagia bacterium]